jgi:hypothetical protein
MRRREYYIWLRLLRLPLTISLEPLRFTIGLAFYWCRDGSGQHSHCYRAELVLPIFRFTTVIRWGPRPIAPSPIQSQGFGNIGGRTHAERHKAIEKYEDEDED